MPADINDDALRFFSGLSGRLRIELDIPPKRAVPHLYNLASDPQARVVSVTLELKVLVSEPAPLLRELTPAEWDEVVIRSPKVRMRGESDLVVEHVAPDGLQFTVRDLARAIEETERRGRPESQWLGGIDVHHVYFEGIELQEDGVWLICWGS